MSRYGRQLQAAQRAHDDASPDDRAEDAAEYREAYIDAMLADPKWRAARKAEADEWCDGTFDGEHYSAVERALADLAEVPADRLIGSDALATVLRLADVHAKARADKLREMAEAEYGEGREPA